MSDLDSVLQRTRMLLRRAAAHLDGDLDGEQLQLFDLAFCTAEVEAAAEAMRIARRQDPAGKLLEQLAGTFAAEALAQCLQRISIRLPAFGLGLNDLPADWPTVIAPYLAPGALTSLGTAVLECNGDLPLVGLDGEQRMMRDTFRQFASDIVAPRAERVHRQDALIPDAILEPLKAMGCFGLSVPERFGGLKPDDRDDSLGMVVVTEELSRGSLGAAGSLITRPEIMARALLDGGTPEQQRHWLPALASGERLCAISVTEPSTGSDVAAVALKATRTNGGWRLNGGKTWCTFAGKAHVVLVLARTDAEAQPAHRGLSLFLVEKPSYDGHDFEYRQEHGGRLSGRAIPTIGYRGMHSYEMFYDDFFVADEALVGGAAGAGRGFYFTMRGFMGGRLQTAARACGVMQASLEASLAYGADRRVFGRAVADFPLTRAKYARMAAWLHACRHFTYAVARLMDADQGQMEASLVKLLACRAAEWVSREAQQIHGGMGYAEETAVSRYFADARVLSIFEGAEETLAIRVIGKALVDRARTGNAA
jgi:(2S)-methylsuccinyl-CoA dehydrogenase